MQPRTDLALECLDFAKDITPNGVSKETFTQDGVEATRVRIETEEGARLIGKPIGEYLTMETADFKSASADFEKEDVYKRQTSNFPDLAREAYHSLICPSSLPERSNKSRSRLEAIRISIDGDIVA